jgi:hypothetical protein
MENKGSVDKSIFKDGVLENKKVTVKRYNSIEHGDISKISSIVLHRTAGSKASSSLSAYDAGQKTGAHFLIGEKESFIKLPASKNNVGMLESCILVA